LGRRRDATILAASLVAHLALLGAWMATRPPERFVEPPAIQVTLVTPHRSPDLSKFRPTPSAPASSRSRAETTISPLPPAAPTTAPVAPRILSEEELLAGRPTDADQLKAALNQRKHVTPWDGCKKLPGPPDWTAPPCPPSGSNEEAKHVLSLPDLQGHGEIARKDRIQAYKGGTGPYPGVSCVIFHKC
jgi:hypothetical protein